MMPVSIQMSLLIIMVSALGTFLPRVLPFLLFPADKKIPWIVLYLGKVLPPAIIGLLVVYCLKNVNLFGGDHGIPEFSAVICTVLLHRWKRNNLLSIGGGTVIYMVLLRILPLF